MSDKPLGTVNREKLIAATKLASDVADKKSPSPIMACAAVRVIGGALVVQALGEEVSATTKIPIVGTAGAGGICVDAAALAPVVKSFTADEVSLYVDDKARLVMLSGKAKVAVPGRPVDDFPAVPQVDVSALATIDAAAFVTGIRKTIYAVNAAGGSASGRSMLIVESDGAALTFCGISGHRLAEIKVPSTIPAGMAIVATHDGMARILGMLDGVSGDARVGMSGAEHFAVSAGDTTVTVRKSSAARVPYEQVTPKHSNKAFFSRVELLSAVRRASLTSKPTKDRDTGLFLSIDGTEATMESSDPTLGESRTVIELKKKAKAISFEMSIRYLAESLGLIDTADVQLEYGGELDPIMVRPAGSEAEMHLIMVMMKGRK